MRVDSDGDIRVSTVNGPRWAWNPKCLERAQRSDMKKEPDTGIFKRGQGVRIRKDITVEQMRNMQQDFGGMAPAMKKVCYATAFDDFLIMKLFNSASFGEKIKDLAIAIFLPIKSLIVLVTIGY